MEKFHNILFRSSIFAIAVLSKCQSCSDKLLLLDGIETNCTILASKLSPNVSLKEACSTYFCHSAICEYAFACDGTCEYCEPSGNTNLPDWWVCLPGEFLDCHGVCHSRSDCSLASVDYTTIQHWVGDGYCDDGCGGRSCGRKTDNGKVLSLNCPLYDCDGLDCELCGDNPPFVPSDAKVPRHLLPSSDLLDQDSDRELSSYVKSRSIDSGNLHFFPQCRDMPLWFDSKLISCGEILAASDNLCESTFCDECDTAGGCDKACGYCGDHWTPPIPSKKIFLASSGLSNMSDAVSWVILLTMTVSPIQGVSHTKRVTPLLRLRDYARTLFRWAAGHGNIIADIAQGSSQVRQRPWPLVVVESSGVNLSPLKEAVMKGHQDAIINDRAPRDVEFVSFLQDITELGSMNRGKGVAEYCSINRAISKSKFISEATHIVKVTGRYFIHNLDRELHRLSKQAILQQQNKSLQVLEISDEKMKVNMIGILKQLDWPLVITQSTPSPWTLFDGVCRSEVVGFNKLLVGWLLADQDESRGRPMERVLFEKCKLINGTMRAQHQKDAPILTFKPLIIDVARNAENDEVQLL